MRDLAIVIVILLTGALFGYAIKSVQEPVTLDQKDLQRIETIEVRNEDSTIVKRLEIYHYKPIIDTVDVTEFEY